MAKNRLDLGDAISMEDALSMLVVIFVLFVVFLVPLVSMDKPPQLDNAPQDPFWNAVTQSLLQSSQDDIQSYKETFQLLQPLHQRVSKDSTHTYIEVLQADSSLTILRIENNNFISLNIQKHGTSTIYRWGNLLWNSIEKEWRRHQDTTAYHSNATTEKMEYEYRQWFRKSQKQ